MSGEKSAIKKRYFHLNEEILKQNPALCSHGAASLDRRQDLTIDMMPKLGMEAATNVIEEWGQPKSTITHLIFCSLSGADMPDADLQLLKMLGLRPSVNRVMLHNLGCYAGGTVLRIAKDIAENNPGARVLTVCIKSTIVSFRAPSEDDQVYLLSNALFGDRAAAVIIGTAPPNATIERPIFQIISASQSVVPDSGRAIEGHHREVGLAKRTLEKVPEYIAADLEEILVEAFGSINVTDWNSIYWAAHPGGRRILDCIVSACLLYSGRDEEKVDRGREGHDGGGDGAGGAIRVRPRPHRRDGRFTECAHRHQVKS